MDYFPLAKISIPSSKGALPRKRLFEVLGGKQSITWIAAPAGSGKTTLIASYLDTRQSPAIWYRIDEGDTDVASFFYHLGIAVKRASHRKKPLPSFSPEYMQGLSAFSLRYFEALYSSVQSGSIIVFDNYERLPDDASLHRVLSEGLAILPDSTRFL